MQKFSLVSISVVILLVVAFFSGENYLFSACDAADKCNKTYFWHINGCIKHSIVVGHNCFFLGDEGTQMTSDDDVTKEEGGVCTSCECRNPPLNDGAYYKCNAVSGNFGSPGTFTLSTKCSG